VQDLWLLSATLFYLISGVRPYGDTSETEALWQAVESEKTPKLSDAAVMGNRANPVLSEVLLKGMQRKKGLRFQTAAEMQQQLMTIIASKGDLWFHVFFSYRVNLEQDLLPSLYAGLVNRTVTEKGADCRVRVYWDAKCIKMGNNWREDFLSGLEHSLMFVPVITPLVLQDAIKSCPTAASDGWCDNVLLEWVLALILLQQQKIKLVVPIFSGHASYDDREGGTGQMDAIDNMPAKGERWAALQRNFMHSIKRDEKGVAVGLISEADGTVMLFPDKISTKVVDSLFPAYQDFIKRLPEADRHHRYSLKSVINTFLSYDAIFTDQIPADKNLGVPGHVHYIGDHLTRQIQTKVILYTDKLLLQRMDLAADGGAAAQLIPRKPTLRELLGDTLVKAGGFQADFNSTVETQEYRQVKYWLVYFGGNWADADRQFCPKLKQTFSFLSANPDYDVMVVYVGDDKTENASHAYLQTHGKWLAVPFNNRQQVRMLSQRFEVRGLPTLVVMQKDGSGRLKVLNDNAVSDVYEDVEARRFPWRPSSIVELLGTQGFVDKDGNTHELQATLRKHEYW
jgi:serine/threonine protein kinase